MQCTFLGQMAGNTGIGFGRMEAMTASIAYVLSRVCFPSSSRPASCAERPSTLVVHTSKVGDGVAAVANCGGNDAVAKLLLVR
jgi:hypothetical protein